MQYQEELGHAMKLFDFMLDNGGHIVLKALAKPPSQFKGALAVMKETLKHEQKVTGAITKLYELTVKEKDYPAQILLQWFISEQTEEEKTVGDIIAQMKMVGDSGSGLLLIDQHLAGRAVSAHDQPETLGSMHVGDIGRDGSDKALAHVTGGQTTHSKDTADER